MRDTLICFIATNKASFRIKEYLFCIIMRSPGAITSDGKGKYETCALCSPLEQYRAITSTHTETQTQISETQA